MAHYFFHLHDSNGPLMDLEGRRVDSLDEVRRQALRDARSILSHEVQAGLLDLRSWLEVVDETGALVLRLRFADAVELWIDGGRP